MSFVSIESIFQAERELRPKSRHLYRAVECKGWWGIGDGIDFVTGITLERITPLPEWDPIFDDLAEYGIEAPIHLPEEGLIVGKVYEAVTTAYRDWETGIPDDYDTDLVLVEDYDE
jgi:hypothetical protein